MELQELKKQIEESETKRINLTITTEHWYGFAEPFLSKDKHKFNVSKKTMYSLIETSIDKERERENKLIDILIGKVKNKDKE